jgi:heptosyltransferase II
MNATLGLAAAGVDPSLEGGDRSSYRFQSVSMTIDSMPTSMTSPSERGELPVRLHNWIGDVIVSLPALNLLSQAGVPIRCVGKVWAPKLLAGHHWPIDVLPKGTSARIRWWSALPTPIIRGPDRVDSLLLATSFSAALEARLAGRRPMGLATDHRRLLLARSVKRPSTGHALVDPWVVACDFLGIRRPPPESIQLQVSPSARTEAIHQLTAAGVLGSFVMICPFSTGVWQGQSKRWPGMTALCERLVASGQTIVICPGPGEEDEARSQFPGATVLTDIRLDVYAALLAQADLVVANDTGPGHMAAAVGTPLISVLGPSDAARWAPRGSHVHVAQKLAGRWCSVEEVHERAQDLLGGKQGPSGGRL